MCIAQPRNSESPERCSSAESIHGFVLEGSLCAETFQAAAPAHMGRTYRSRGTALLELQEAGGKAEALGRRRNTISSCTGNVLLFIGCEGSNYRLKLKTLNTKG